MIACVFLLGPIVTLSALGRAVNPTVNLVDSGVTSLSSNCLAASGVRPVRLHSNRAPDFA